MKRIAVQLSLYDIIPPLQPYVKVISIIEMASSENGGSDFRVLPDTCVELFLNYSNKALATIKAETDFESPGSFVNCRMSRYMDVQMQPGTACVAVCFQPGAAHYFFPVPMSELADRTTDLSLLWKDDAGMIGEKLAACKTNTARVHVAQQYLLRRLKKNYKERNDLEYCLWQINLLKGQVRIADLSRKTNISQRQLGRQFNAHIGISAKEFVRVSRFIHSLSQLKKTPAARLTEIAYENGYYDQAHFIHDCKEIAGLAPGELLSSRQLVF